MTSNALVNASLYDSSLAHYLSQLPGILKLDLAKERELTKRWCENSDVKAAHELVVSHLPLVVKIAFCFKNYGLPLSDLISEGNIGLMKAVKKFKREMKCRLSTYALWWIKASIQEYILKTWSFVKIGTSALKKRLFYNLKNVEKKIVDQGEVKQNTEEGGNSIAVGGSSNTFHPLSLPEITDTDINKAAYVTSLNYEYDDSGVEFIETVSNESDVRQDDALIKKENNSKMIEALRFGIQKLTERERSIISQRRLQDKPVTLDILAQKYEISKERVRQIEQRAMEKLYQYVNSS